jgi:hypothetical protein
VFNKLLINRIASKKLNLVIILIMIVSLAGCSSHADDANRKTQTEDKKNKEYSYIENHQYNVNGAADDNTIYIIFQNKLYAIDKNSYQYNLILESNYGLAGIALYKDWIYCIENPGINQNTTVFRIGKDGQDRVDLLNNSIHYYCWIYGDVLYTLNFGDSLKEAYNLNKDGSIGDILKTTESHDFSLFTDVYNKLYNHITVDKSDLNLAANAWTIKHSETEKEINTLEVFNDDILFMNGEIAYINYKNADYMEIVNLKGDVIKDIKLDKVLLGFLNYDKDWIYYYTNPSDLSKGMLCCRMNRKTYEVEELFEGLPDGQMPNSMFIPYGKLLIYTEYSSNWEDYKLVIYNTISKEKTYIK